MKRGRQTGGLGVGVSRQVGIEDYPNTEADQRWFRRFQGNPYLACIDVESLGRIVAGEPFWLHPRTDAGDTSAELMSRRPVGNNPCLHSRTDADGVLLIDKGPNLSFGRVGQNDGRLFGVRAGQFSHHGLDVKYLAMPWRNRPGAAELHSGHFQSSPSHLDASFGDANFRGSRCGLRQFQTGSRGVRLGGEDNNTSLRTVDGLLGDGAGLPQFLNSPQVDVSYFQFGFLGPAERGQLGSPFTAGAVMEPLELGLGPIKLGSGNGCVLAKQPIIEVEQDLARFDELARPNEYLDDAAGYAWPDLDLRRGPLDSPDGEYFPTPGIAAFGDLGHHGRRIGRECDNRKRCHAKRDKYGFHFGVLAISGDLFGGNQAQANTAD